jgi:hypothetical protein
MYTLAKRLQSFDAVESMNVIVSKFKETVRGILPKSVMTTIDFLASHSCKIKGVSWATYDYMKEQTGLSVPTLKRAIKTLTQLGIIQVVHTWVGGRQKANIIQIQRKIDWQSIEAALLKRMHLEFVTTDTIAEEAPETIEPPSEPVNETHDDTQNDTLCEKQETEKGSDDADFWGIPDITPHMETLLSHSNFKHNQNEYINRFTFYNWLKDE